MYVLTTHLFAMDMEYQVQGAYLYNFMRFITWQNEDKSEILHLCILGNSPFSKKLALFEKESIRKHAIKISYYQQVQDATICHVLYISRSEEAQIKSILSLLSEQEILTVSDIEHFSREGGIIGLFIKNNKVRFDINLTQARKVGLYISSKLLEIAEKIY